MMQNRAIVVKTMGTEDMRGTVMIRAAGNQKIAGAIIDGIKPTITPLTNRELAAVRAELARLRAREGTKKPREDREFRRFQAELNRKYRIKPHGELYGNALVAYAITSLTIVELIKRLRALWMEGRR